VGDWFVGDWFVSGLTSEERGALERAADAYLTAMRTADWEGVAQSFRRVRFGFRPTRLLIRVVRRLRDGSGGSRKLCYVRGLEGILVGLSEQVG
jgi:hypothetical protein